MVAFKRVLPAVVLSVLGLWLMSASVLAGGNPGRQPAPTPADAVGTFCGADLGVVVAHVEINKEFMKTFTLGNGTIRLAINGRFVSTVTGNGRTLTFNTSGPATLILSADGSQVLQIVTRGRTFVIEPFGMFVYSGLVIVDPATGLVTSHSGQVTDVCALLR